MTEISYRQFCPVAMAGEVLGTRWTLLLLRELVCGTTRFNDLRRGVPRMSPALLSKRLKELEAAGIVERMASPQDPSVLEYHLTPAGREFKPIIDAIGVWGHRWTETRPQLEKLDAGLLMWDMRRRLKVDELPRRRNVIQFIYPERPDGERTWWIVVDPHTGPDLCATDPGFDVDLYVRTDLRTMTAIWMGIEPMSRSISDNRLTLIGDAGLQKRMATWLGLSSFAGVKKQVT